jgi:Thrombospondin type 3 repeat
MKVIRICRRIALPIAVLCSVGLGRAAWGATGSVGGASQPSPSNTTPEVGEMFDVTIDVSNTSFSLEAGEVLTPINAQVSNALTPASPAVELLLACDDAFCATESSPQVLQFLPQGGNGCVSNDACVLSCAQGLTANRVSVALNPVCDLGPFQLFKVLATVHVQMIANPPPQQFFMLSRALLRGSAGTCNASNFCTNAGTKNPPNSLGDPAAPANAAAEHSCPTTGANCDWSALTQTGTGSAMLSPQFCGNGILDTAGETCDPPESLGGATGCRDDCTFCGDGITDVADGETCDDTNDIPYDGCGIAGGGANNCLVCSDGTACSGGPNNVVDDAGDCFSPACALGFCDPHGIQLAPNTPCSVDADTTPVTPADCQTPLCQADGTCLNTPDATQNGLACGTNPGSNGCDCQDGSCVVPGSGLCGAGPPPPPDKDNDGVADVLDNCPFTSNADQKDSDGDGIGDACDNCPTNFNATQSDGDKNGVGDRCDNNPSRPFTLTRVRLRATQTPARSTILLRGTLDPTEWSDLRSALNQGLVVGVTGAGLDVPERLVFPGIRCLQIGARIECIGEGGMQAIFQPKRGSNLVSVKIRANNRTFAPPLDASGVEVVLSFPHPSNYCALFTSCNGLDRGDAISACKVTSRGVSANCRK